MRSTSLRRVLVTLKVESAIDALSSKSSSAAIDLLWPMRKDPNNMAKKTHALDFGLGVATAIDSGLLVPGDSGFLDSSFWGQEGASATCRVTSFREEPVIDAAVRARFLEALGGLTDSSVSRLIGDGPGRLDRMVGKSTKRLNKRYSLDVYFLRAPPRL